LFYSFYFWSQRKMPICKSRLFNRVQAVHRRMTGFCAVAASDFSKCRNGRGFSRQFLAPAASPSMATEWLRDCENRANAVPGKGFKEGWRRHPSAGVRFGGTVVRIVVTAWRARVGGRLGGGDRAAQRSGLDIQRTAIFSSVSRLSISSVPDSSNEFVIAAFPCATLTIT
jgi:hypothetical protein